MRPTRVLAAAAVLLACAPHGASAAAQSKRQQKCVTAIGSASAAVARARAALNERCLDAFGKGALDTLGAPSLRSCFARDSQGKVAKQIAKLAQVQERSCSAPGDVPDFGLGRGAGPIATVTAFQTTSVTLDVLSENLFVSALPCGSDPAACRCQAEVIDRADALADAVRAEFAGCLRRALKAGAGDAAALAACLDDPALAGSVAADSKQKLAKQEVKLAKGIEKRCGAVGAADPFPGQCVGQQGSELAACVAGAARCRACIALEATHGLDADCDLADDAADNQSCPGGALAQATFLLPSEAQPPHTPGSPGAEPVDEPKLLAQFGSADIDLNHVTYTRYAWRNPPKPEPDAILVLIPGFEGGASGFQILAENLLPRAWLAHGQSLEVWAVDRRGQQLEDRLGLDLAEAKGDPQLALDWLFGEELGLQPSPELPRRAQFYEPNGEIPFLAEWTPLVHSIDFDAVVEAARAVARDANVFLGGHSAGTGFTARYAATDFDLAGLGPAEPGYAKLRGLVLLEGGGGSTSGTPPDDAALDRIEQRFDGDLYDAVESGEPRCPDLLTACTPDVQGEDPVACAAFASQDCEPVPAYSILVVNGAPLLTPQLLAVAEPVAIQAASDPDTGLAILQVEQRGIAGNTAVAAVPELGILAALPQATAEGLIGLFVDDEGFAAGIASFISMSVGAPGPPGSPPRSWLDTDEADQFPPCPGLGCVTPDDGPAPTALPPVVWGVEQEPIRLDRLMPTFYLGGTNFTDWYYPSSGLSVTQGLLGLDSTALSADPPEGRGRRDIENLTQAAAIDIPVIGLGGSNGLTPVPASYLPFAASIGPCSAPSCDGTTPRVVDPASPSEAFPSFGGVAGGYEVYISEGYAHVDPLAAEDGEGNRVIGPLADFLARNAP